MRATARNASAPYVCYFLCVIPPPYATTSLNAVNLRAQNLRRREITAKAVFSFITFDYNSLTHSRSVRREG